MSVLLTGANGQVGWEILRQARECGMAVTGLTRAQLDITDATAVEREIASLEPSMVINAAAYTAVDKAESEPELAMAINRDGPANLAEGCRVLGIPLIHFSTDYVFDGRQERPYREDDEPNPMGVYGKTKYAGEQAVRERLEAHTIFRTSWVFGSHGHNFVKTMLRLAERNEVIKVVDDQKGTPSAAAMIAGVALRLLDSGTDPLPFGTYHLGGAPAVSWYEFAREIFRVAQKAKCDIPRQLLPITTEEFPTPARRPANSSLDSSRLSAWLGDGIDLNWQDYLKPLIEDWQRSVQ